MIFFGLLPVANENHLSLIVPFKSLLNQCFHLGEVFPCRIITRVFSAGQFIVIQTISMGG